MTDKIRISDGELKGGLVEEGKTQKYQMNYLPEVFEGSSLKYTAKMELAILTPGKDKDFFHSLRFTSPDQVRVVLLKFINAYAFFLNRKGLLNRNNIKTLPVMFGREIEKSLSKMTLEKQLKLS